MISGLPGDPTTNASGVYTATVAEGWAGTATPVLAGYSFTPSFRTYTNVTSDQTGQDYEATLLVFETDADAVTVPEGGTAQFQVR
ncbi:MAG: hypothetical protein ACUVV5_11740, partial [Candidatus Aminicenantales bacterium]